jgi:hypothetical protein
MNIDAMAEIEERRANMGVEELVEWGFRHRRG